MTQLKAVSSYDYPETDYYQEEVYDYTEEYIYEGTLIAQYFVCGNSVQFSLPTTLEFELLPTWILGPSTFKFFVRVVEPTDFWVA